MTYTSEDIRKAGELFFHLLDKRILPANDILATLYYEVSEVKEIIDNWVAEGGLQVFATRQNLHLVARGENSIFATTYSQMKEKYKKLERKKHFYLANIIICVFLAEIDRENQYSLRLEEQGISYYKLEEVISQTIEAWKKRSLAEDTFAQDFALAVDDIHHLWTVEMSHSKAGKDETGFSLSAQTRLGFINEALKPLENEQLIINLSRENRIIPKDELYERLERLYHGGDRYEEIISLIKFTKKELEDGQASQN